MTDARQDADELDLSPTPLELMAGSCRTRLVEVTMGSPRRVLSVPCRVCGAGIGVWCKTSPFAAAWETLATRCEEARQQLEATRAEVAALRAELDEAKSRAAWDRWLRAQIGVQPGEGE